MTLRTSREYLQTAQWSRWDPYTPSWFATSVNPSIGNGTIKGSYRRIGSTGFCRGRIKMGSTTTFGTGNWYVTLPTGWEADALIDDGYQEGHIMCNDTGTNIRDGVCWAAPGAQVLFLSTGTTWTAVGPTSPFTWASTDFLAWNITLELNYTAT